MLDLVVLAFLTCSLGLVVALGGGPERMGGQIMLVVLALSAIRMIIIADQVHGFDLLGLLSDVLAFVGFLWIAVFAWRLWPIWTAALQLIAIGAHFGPALNLPIAPLAYAIMRSAPTATVIVTLIAATGWHCKKMRSGISMPPWRTWSGPLNRISPMNWQAGYSRNLAR